jgi:hypothetical protein
MDFIAGTSMTKPKLKGGQGAKRPGPDTHLNRDSAERKFVPVQLHFST